MASTSRRLNFATAAQRAQGGGLLKKDGVLQEEPSSDLGMCGQSPKANVKTQEAKLLNSHVAARQGKNR